MFLEFQSICILASIALLIQNNHDQEGYAFLLFVVGVMSHALEAVYQHHNLAEDRKSQALQNLLGSLKITKKDNFSKDIEDDWADEEKEEKDLR